MSEAQPRGSAAEPASAPATESRHSSAVPGSPASNQDNESSDRSSREGSHEHHVDDGENAEGASGQQEGDPYEVEFWGPDEDANWVVGYGPNDVGIDEDYDEEYDEDFLAEVLEEQEEIEEEYEEDEEDEDDFEDEDDPHFLRTLLRAARTGQINRRQLFHILGVPEGRASDENEAERARQIGRLLWPQNGQPPKDPNRFPKVPSEEGIKLMRSGAFGASPDDEYDNRCRPRQKTPAQRLLDRELGLGDMVDRKRNNQLLAQGLLPSTEADHIIHYDDPVYSGQFSDDGNFFFTACQDFKVRMYDTSEPFNWKHYKTAEYPFGQWTLTDATLSPDNKWLAYTSISSMVCITPTDPLDKGDPYTLNLTPPPALVSSTGRRYPRSGFSGIWSVRFSGDGRELVVGTNQNSLGLYDIESRRMLHFIQGHDNDVNAVCFADKSSPHILYSGSDDHTIKIWDRRSLGDSREAGAFVGHIEGVTYIDSKGDGRYVLSNGKDQSMKLWDIRTAMSTDRYRELNPHYDTRYSTFDYRTDRYNEDNWDVMPHDNSVVTYRGHKVLSTLIRCHFSPPASTNSRYVYTGSRDGKVYVYNLDATIAKIIDVREATMNSKPTYNTEGSFRRWYTDGNWATCVRDASWHPNAPFIAASAWNGHALSRGTCTLHSFNETKGDEGIPAMSRNLDSQLRPQQMVGDDDEE